MCSGSKDQFSLKNFAGDVGGDLGRVLGAVGALQVVQDGAGGVGRVGAGFLALDTVQGLQAALPDVPDVADNVGEAVGRPDGLSNSQNVPQVHFHFKIIAGLRSAVLANADQK